MMVKMMTTTVMMMMMERGTVRSRGARVRRHNRFLLTRPLDRWMGGSWFWLMLMMMVVMALVMVVMVMILKSMMMITR